MTGTTASTASTAPASPVTFDEAEALVAGAAGPEALFGPYDGTPEACLRTAGRRYRALARLVHPDAAPDGRRDAAQETFTRLGDLWARYQQGITGVTGRQIVITTKRHAYTVGAERARGDIATLYAAAYGDDEHALLKVPRDVADNDLMEREAEALRRIGRDGRPDLAPYVPSLVESFRHRDAATGTERRANVVRRVLGFHSLAEVAEAYPGGLDARDVAWMWRRLLVALGYAHHAGVVHGAVVPEHVLVHPRDHGLVLVDWCYSVLLGDDGRAAGHVPAMLDRHAALYPPEVTGRRPPGPATDIHMATRVMTGLLRDDAPRPLLRFARGCTLPAMNRRPDDAWRLLRELDELLEKLYGPRRFRPFTMPARRPDGRRPTRTT